MTAALPCFSRLYWEVEQNQGIGVRRALASPLSGSKLLQCARLAGHLAPLNPFSPL